jgi:hypothetical protein
LKPRGVVVNMIPGLPAHILFMCVRYADSLNDADMLKSLMNSAINGIKQVVKVGPPLTSASAGCLLWEHLWNDQMPLLCPSFISVFAEPHDSSGQFETQLGKEFELLGKEQCPRTCNLVTTTYHLCLPW